MVMQSELLTPREAAQFLGLSAGTLAIWRCRKRYGLAYVKVGSRVRYRLRDLQAFIDAGTADTSQVMPVGRRRK